LIKKAKGAGSLKFVNLDPTFISSPEAPHKAVLLNEILEFFKAHAAPKKSYWDGTFGRGGHLKAVLSAFPEIKAYAMDCDQAAIDFAEQNFADEITAQKLSVARANYSEFKNIQAQENWPTEFDLMLIDLGVSSPQLDEAARGFSFYHDGPLDMRMDQSQVLSAEEVVNDWDEEDLYTVFTQLGEVRRPNRVLRAILHDRKTKRFTTTRELASLIERVDGWHKKGMHPATKYFMGIRLAVNNELGGLRETLPKLMAALAPHGLLAVLTFHSLEDRIVKNIFKDEKKLGRMVNKKVVTATLDELKENSRSRSAKLRVFERTTDETANLRSTSQSRRWSNHESNNESGEDPS
jgi:16S rRNA (cytosine1402-N4)-methyltransferase